MNEDFTSEALLHLLEQSEPARRAQFEQHLHAAAAATAAYKTCVDAYARFALETAPSVAVSPQEKNQILQAILAETSPSSIGRSKVDEARSAEMASQRRVPEEQRVVPDALRHTPRSFPKRTAAILWPLAAALLLGLNLWQWVHRRSEHPVDGNAEVIRSAAPAAERATSIAATAGNSAAEKAAPVATVVGVQRGISPRVAAEVKRLEALQREYQMVSKDRDSVTRQYNSILSQLVAAASADPGTGKLVAMELVDADSYNRGQRNGLISQAETLLTTPGIVAIGPATATQTNTGNAGGAPASATLTSPVALAGTINTSGAFTATTLAGSSTLLTTATTTDLNSAGAASLTAAAPTPASSSLTSTNSGTTTSNSAQNVSSTSISAPTQNDSSASAPYAWSVYDDSAHEGYLNLYNLPNVPSDSQLELWVQPAGSTDFQPVGQVPSQYYGQSGSLYYKLPNNVATPSQVMITVEPAGTQPTTPTGTTVLRGP